MCLLPEIPAKGGAQGFPHNDIMFAILTIANNATVVLNWDVWECLIKHVDK